MKYNYLLFCDLGDYKNQVLLLSEEQDENVKKYLNDEITEDEFIYNLNSVGDATQLDIDVLGDLFFNTDFPITDIEYEPIRVFNMKGVINNLLNRGYSADNIYDQYDEKLGIYKLGNRYDYITKDLETGDLDELEKNLNENAENKTYMKPTINKELIMDHLKELEKFYVIDYNNYYFDKFVEKCIKDLQSDDWNWKDGYETEIITDVILDNASSYDLMWDMDGKLYGIVNHNMRTAGYDMILFDDKDKAELFREYANKIENIDTEGDEEYERKYNTINEDMWDLPIDSVELDRYWEDDIVDGYYIYDNKVIDLLSSVVKGNRPGQYYYSNTLSLWA